jgi:hypothetical protein
MKKIKESETYYTFAAFKKDFPKQARALLPLLGLHMSDEKAEAAFIQSRVAIKADYALRWGPKQPHITLHVQSVSYCWAYGAGGVGAGWSID